MQGLSRVMPPMNFKWEILFGRTIPMLAPSGRAEKNPGITGGTLFSLSNIIFYNDYTSQQNETFFLWRAYHYVFLTNSGSLIPNMKTKFLHRVTFLRKSISKICTFCVQFYVFHISNLWNYDRDFMKIIFHHELSPN